MVTWAPPSTRAANTDPGSEPAVSVRRCATRRRASAKGVLGLCNTWMKRTRSCVQQPSRARRSAAPGSRGCTPGDGRLRVPSTATRQACCGSGDGQDRNRSWVRPRERRPSRRSRSTRAEQAPPSIGRGSLSKRPTSSTLGRSLSVRRCDGSVGCGSGSLQSKPRTNNRHSSRSRAA